MPKNGIHILILALLISCQTADENHNGKDAEAVERTAETPDETSDALPGEALTLVPLTIVDSTSQEVYSRYGIEFDGNCYSCDLSKISIDDKHLSLINVCDPDDVVQMKIQTRTRSTNEIRAQSGSQVFIFTKTDDAPVFRLSIEGGGSRLENKRMAAYFTTAEALPQFKAHNCGEFDG